MSNVSTTFSTLPDALDFHAIEHGEKVVLRRLGFQGKENDEITFSQLQDRAKTFAKSLMEISETHDRILLAYPSCNEFVVAFMGCLYARRIAVPVSLGANERSGERILGIAQDCNATTLVSSTVNAVGLVGATRSNCATISHEALEGGQSEQKLPVREKSDICFLQYTSGSTGKPKGVIVTHENLAVNLTQILYAIGHNHTRMVSWLPQFHDMGLIGTMLLPIYAAIESTYMSPLEFVKRPVRWLQALSDFKAQGSVAPNFGFSYLLERLRPGDLDDIDLSHVTCLMCGSEPISLSVLDAFTKELKVSGLQSNTLMPTYGLAEATLMVSARPRGSRVRVKPSPGDRADLVACGIPAVGLDIEIIDADGKKCAEGIEGEINISGQNICKGYWGKPPIDGALPTGDLGFIWDGELFVTGRKKDLIILRGRNFYPTDIEMISAKCTPRAGANSCAAIGIMGINSTEELIVAQEVPSVSIRDLDADTLRKDIVEAILSSSGVAPSKVLLLRSNTLPRTTSGKVSRFALKTELQNNTICEFI